MTKPVSPGDIVQISAAHHWPGCLVVVDKVAPWGITAYMQLPGPISGVVARVSDKRAFIRLNWSDFAETGGKVP